MLSAVSNLQEAVNTIIKILGLGAANLSENVAEGTNLHTVLCSGKLISNLIKLDNLNDFLFQVHSVVGSKCW